jgi:hypothetical protein
MIRTFQNRLRRCRYGNVITSATYTLLAAHYRHMTRQIVAERTAQREAAEDQAEQVIKALAETLWVSK